VRNEGFSFVHSEVLRVLVPPLMGCVVCHERDIAKNELSRLHAHPIEITYDETQRGLINIVVTNKGDREERIVNVEMCLLSRDGSVETPINAKYSDKYPLHQSLKRVKEFPHVMPPRSSFEIEFLITLGTFIAHGLGGFYIVAKIEDGTRVESKRTLMENPDPFPTDDPSSLTESPPP
jgi:hypothetical protein